MSFRLTNCSRPRIATLLAALSLAAVPSGVTYAQEPRTAASGATTAAVANAAPGKPLTAEQLAPLLPPSVYFQGKTAPVQTRNAGGTNFGDGAIVWVALVDSSGYSSAIQEKYQFYFVTEGPVRVGGTLLPAGAYGGGFLSDHLLLMDVGGHPVAQGPLQTDEALRRPRPLQVLPDQPNAVKLYLGRRWVRIEAAPSR